MMKSKILIFALLIFISVKANAQWQPDMRLTNDSAISVESFNNAWCIASSGDSVHIVWYDDRDGNNEIYYKRSIDGGINWGADSRLTSDSAGSLFPSVAVVGSVVHMVWHDNRDGNNEIYYKRSTDGGTTWGGDMRLTNNSFWSTYPSLAVSGLEVHVVWRDNRDGNDEIYYKRSTDGGVSWGLDTRLTIDPAVTFFPSVAVSGSEVHVIWWDYRDSNNEIYYKRSTDGGTTWSADTRLTINAAYSEFNSIAVSDSVVHIVWYDQRDGNDEIYYKRSTDGGISWGLDTRLTNNPGFSWFPSVAATDAVVHVVWGDSRDGNFEIYYKRSTDGGINWSADTRLTNNSDASILASVSVSGSVVHLAWYDDRDGNNEIYYKRDPTSNAVGINEFPIDNSFLISPNPANDNFTITTNAVLINAHVQIFNFLGKNVFEINISNTLKTEINLQNISSGMYFVKVLNGEKYFVRKLIVKHD